MKRLIILLIYCCPVVLFAQKGSVVPDSKPQTPAVTPAPSPSLTSLNIKVWTVEEQLVTCSDSINRCYSITENGIRKLIPENDVFDFDYLEGFIYTIKVKQLPKVTATNSSANKFYYIFEKVISMNAPPVKTATPEPVKNATDELRGTVEGLKKEVEELKKQLKLVQLQLDMQLQLLQKR